MVVVAWKSWLFFSKLNEVEISELLCASWKYCMYIYIYIGSFTYMWYVYFFGILLWLRPEEYYPKTGHCPAKNDDFGGVLTVLLFWLSLLHYPARCWSHEMGIDAEWPNIPSVGKHRSRHCESSHRLAGVVLDKYTLSAPAIYLWMQGYTKFFYVVNKNGLMQYRLDHIIFIGIRCATIIARNHCLFQQSAAKPMAVLLLLPMWQEQTQRMLQERVQKQLEELQRTGTSFAVVICELVN